LDLGTLSTDGGDLNPYSTVENPGSLRRISFDNIGAFQALVGEFNNNLKRIEKLLSVKISVKGNSLSIDGDQSPVEIAERLIKQLYSLSRESYPIHPADIDQGVKMLTDDPAAKIRDVLKEVIFTSHNKRPITPKTWNQKQYIQAIRTFDIVFGIGPAGTGKTFLAMAMAMASFSKKQLRRIILARPAVEAGEKLGFLPGDMHEKVNPYLRPLYDALHDMIDPEKVTRMVEREDIEIAPLAFMRGRTLNDSFVILDEAQNTTSEQMKMFLTRLGYSSKAVITGDVTQIDLPAGIRSGLVEARAILQNIEGISFVTFSEQDVVRHPLVQEIIKAYENRVTDIRNRR
jgi:phosphate starvation-inducible PhoH-like protein